MAKLSKSVIDKINSYDKSVKNTEIAEELWINRNTVAKYRNKVSNEIVDALTKDERKKLDLIERYTPKQLQELLYNLQLDTKQSIEEVIGEPGSIKLALLSDTHYWNKHCARDEIGEFMDIAKDRWVEAFIHSWDLVEGEWVFKWQVYELDKIGFDEQVKDVVENYPDTWIPTYLTQGNHDESFLKKTGGDIGKAISLIRKDIINLWFYDARVKLNWIDINSHHGGWSMSYAKSYKIQKLLENIDPKNQPNLFVSWHWHTALYMFYRKIHSFLPWAFLKENLLAKRFNLDNTIWGWIVEIELDEKGWSKINMEFIKL